MKSLLRKILLNPGPATTTDSVKKALYVEDICPRETEFCAVLEGIQSDLVKIVHGGTDYGCVLFTASGTGGLEAAIASSVPEKGSLLVVENGAYGTRMAKIGLRYGLEVERYQIEYGDYPDLNVLDQMLSSNHQISHLAVVHHETTTGMLNPVTEICQLAHRYGVEVIVDCMSSYAGIPIDIKEWEADYLVSSSNKCIQGMPGMVFVIFKKKLLEKMKEVNRAFYFNIHEQFNGFANSGQMQFTPPVQVAYALKQAIHEYFAETEHGRGERYQKNYDSLFRGLAELGFEFLLPPEQQSKILLAIKEPTDSNYHFDAMHDYLYARGFTIYPGKGAKEATFRLSILGDLHVRDIEDFLSCLKEYLDVAQVRLG